MTVRKEDFRILESRHEEAIERARREAQKVGKTRRVSFERFYGLQLPPRVQKLKKLREVERLVGLVYRYGIEGDERKLLRRAAQLLDDASR